MSDLKPELTSASEVIELIGSDDPVIKAATAGGLRDGPLIEFAYALIADRKDRARAHPTAVDASLGGDVGEAEVSQNQLARNPGVLTTPRQEGEPEAVAWRYRHTAHREPYWVYLDRSPGELLIGPDYEVQPLYLCPAQPDREEVARALATLRGHEDVNAEIWLNDPGEMQPAWRFYLEDADRLTTILAALNPQAQPARQPEGDGA